MGKQIIVRLDQELYDKLKQISVEQERTVSQTVRLAIKQYMFREET